MPIFVEAGKRVSAPLLFPRPLPNPEPKALEHADGTVAHGFERAKGGLVLNGDDRYTSLEAFFQIMMQDVNVSGPGQTLIAMRGFCIVVVKENVSGLKN
jgi:hypothetical protein